MGFDQYHEPPGELPAKTRTFARMCASLTEEAEAIGWYEQRLSVESNEDAKAIMGELGQVADSYESKYGGHLTSPEGTWFGLSDAIRAGEALLYRVTPTTILGFAKGEQFSQTRWRFV